MRLHFVNSDPLYEQCSPIKYILINFLCRLLPPELSRPHDNFYHTRVHPHNYELPCKINNIGDCSFIDRVLYKCCFSFLVRRLLFIVLNSSAFVNDLNIDYHYHHQY